MTYEAFLSMVHPEDREYVDRKWRAALQGEEYDIEHRIIVGDEEKWVREKAELEFDEQGTLKGGFGTVQDITEHKRAEEQMSFQSELLDAIEDSILATDVGGWITYWGKGAASLLGWQPEEVMGLRATDVLFSEESGEVLRRMLRSGQSWSGTVTVRRRDSTLVPLLIRSSPINKDDRAIGVIAVGKDITEQMKEIDIKDEFIGMVSHELRTPLTVIIGALSTARDERASKDEREELMEEASSSAESLASILDNMLELSRYQAGRLKLEKKPVSISSIAKRAVQRVRRKYDAPNIILDISDKIPDVEVDAVRIEQVLYNLLENALKYSPAGSEVRVFGRQEKASLVLGVSDQGVGIAPGNQQKLFEPFARLEESVTAGVGLGLVVCKRLVEAHGGRIWVESKPGEGSTFLFSIPAKERRGSKKAKTS